MDRRQQKTRSAIFEAFGELLSAKRYSKITVQEIIDAANIGRTTFYAHFETKDSLLKEMCVDLFGHIFSDKLNAENTHDFSREAGKPDAMITHILYHLRDNRKNVIGILSCEGGEPFLYFFRQYLEKLIKGHFLASDIQRQVPEDFIINHIASSFVGMIQWWIKNEFKQPPEELAEYFITVISPAMELR